METEPETIPNLLVPRLYHKPQTEMITNIYETFPLGFPDFGNDINKQTTQHFSE